MSDEQGQNGHHEDQDFLDALKGITVAESDDQDPGSGDKDKDSKPKGVKRLVENFRRHRFWSTQPVNVKPASTSGPIHAAVPQSHVSHTPINLPDEFIWSRLDLHEEAQLKEVYDLLSEHYVEDVHAEFRFAYSPEFLKWALLVPNHLPAWLIGVRVKSNQKLVAFISAIPQKMRIRQEVIECAEVNFLCVHKKLRSKRLAPVLIKEVTRQCNLRGTFQAVYTAGVTLPGVIGTSKYYHRVLNPRKLLEAHFASVPRGLTLAGWVKRMALPDSTRIPGFREVVKRDQKAVASLLRAYLSRFAFAPVFSDQEIAHLFYKSRGVDSEVKGQGRTGQVAWSYVVEDPESKEITDFVSFYSLPSTIIGENQHSHVNSVYLYYYATTAALPHNWKTEPNTYNPRSLSEHAKRRLDALIQDILIVAVKAGFDVMNTVTVLDTNCFMESMKFGVGTANLNYYIYNYKTPPVQSGNSGKESSEMGLVLL